MSIKDKSTNKLVKVNIQNRKNNKSKINKVKKSRKNNKYIVRVSNKNKMKRQ
jgi:hypothetical protein